MSVSIPNQAGALKGQRMIYTFNTYTHFPSSSHPLDRNGPQDRDKHTYPQKTCFIHTPHNSHRDLLKRKLNHVFPCSKPSIDAQCPQTKTNLQRLQKEALHDSDPVTSLAFAKDLLWGTPTSPWRPAPHPLPREPSWTSPATALDFSSTSLLPSGHSSKITRSGLPW